MHYAKQAIARAYWSCSGEDILAFQEYYWILYWIKTGRINLGSDCVPSIKTGLENVPVSFRVHILIASDAFLPIHACQLQHAMILIRI